MILVTGPTSLAGDAEVSALHDPRRGRVVFSAPLGTATSGAAFRALLRALGKSPTAAPASERTADELPWARIWLEAYRVRVVLIRQITRLPANVIAEIDDVVTAAGATLYGVADPSSIAPLATRLGDLVQGRSAFKALIKTWPTGRTSIQPPTLLREIEDLATVRRLRARIEHAGSDRRSPAYLIGLTGAAAFPRPERPTSALLSRRLHDLLRPFADPVCLARAVRGAAVAQRPFGWDIGLDPLVLAIGPDDDPAPAPAGPSLRGFWIFRDPLPGAVWALTRLPLTLDELLGMQLSDVLESGTMVSIAGQWYRMAPSARPLLRAQLIGRRLEGAGADDLLLVRPGGRERTHRWLVSMASAAAAEVGVRFLDDELRERPTADERWLLDRGVSLNWLERTARRGIGLALVDLKRVARGVADDLGHYRADDPCGCAEPHVPVPAAAFMCWPPAPRRHHTPFDTGARRNIYRRSKKIAG